MAYDISRMNEGFEYLLEGLPNKDLLALIDDPRFPPELLFKAIKTNSRHPGQIVEVLGHAVLTKIDDKESLYSRLIDKVVISKYIESHTFIPYTYHSYRSPSHDFTDMSAGYIQRLMDAAQLMSRWEAAPGNALVNSVTRTLSAYQQLLGVLSASKNVDNQNPPHGEDIVTLEDTEDQKTEGQELVAARRDLNWVETFGHMDTFIHTVAMDPYLTKNLNILHDALKLLETVEKDGGRSPIPEEVKTRLMALLNESNIFRATAEIRQRLNDIEKSLKNHEEKNISVEEFIERYKAASDFLSQYGRVIPRTDISRISKEFGKFANEAAELFAIDFANSENNQGMVEFCAVIAENETIAHKFLSTLTANSKDMSKIIQAAQALVPNQPR